MIFLYFMSNEAVTRKEIPFFGFIPFSNIKNKNLKERFYYV